MGLMQRALETYEALAPKYAGVYIEGQVPLSPIAHLTRKMDVEISIDLDGEFLSASKLDKDAQAIIIPSTDMAEKRTSKMIAPYPLSENLGYLYGKENKKYQKYVRQLKAWSEFDVSNQVLKAILSYIQRGSIVQDLFRCDLVRINENMNPQNEDIKVTWRVMGYEPEKTSRNRELFDSFIRFYRETHFFENGESLADRIKDVCMITGKQLPVSLGYGKSIIPSYSNAKLISSNDDKGYTFRGRFVNADQALAVSYEAVQKIQNILRWLISNQNVQFGKRVFLCWNPQGILLPRPTSVLLFGNEPIVKFSDYRNNLKKVLMGYRQNITDDNKAIIACFDGTSETTGRLSVVYYNELQASDFLERLYNWDESCCWINGSFGIQSPALNNIVIYAFGDRHDESRIELDDRILRQQMQRLIACRIEKAPIPTDIERALVVRCGSLRLYEEALRRKLLFTTCAVVRKYRMDRKKEEWELALEPNKKDRSYQYGRLLAVMEKVERDTYDSDEKREPNAMRLQSIFVQRPQKATTNIMEQLKKAYYPQLRPGSRIFYDRLIGEIMNEISECEGSWNAPLEDTYLMGYYLQKRELYQTKEKEQKEEVQ